MPSFLSGCLLFIFCLATCAAQETGDPQVLAPGHPAAVLLTPEHGATLLLDTSGSEAGEIVLDAAVPDISYRIVASNGVEISSGSVGTFGWTAIPFLIQAADKSNRNISIQLKTESGAEGFPGVRVRVELCPIPLKAFAENQRAARVFNSAQKLHGSLRGEDIGQAIVKFAQAAGEWAHAGDQFGEALALGGKGESEIELSRYAEAERTLDRALILAVKSAYLRGWLLHLRARVPFDQYEGKLAKNYVEEELRLGEQLGDPALIALARTDLSGVFLWIRDSRMAQMADQAREEAIAAGVPETLALEQRWKGWIEEYYERMVGGMSVLSESEANFRRAGDSRNALDAILEIAEAESLNGDFYSALTTFSKLNPMVATLGNNFEYGSNLVNIGLQYRDLNNSTLAKTYYRRADTAYARSQILFGRMLSHSSLCETEIDRNETANAVVDCKLSLRFARQFDDTAYLGESLYDSGLAERKACSLGQALADFREAVKRTQTINDPRYESKEHIQLGELLDQQGKHREALAEFQQAESLSKGVADSSSLLEAEYAVASWYARDGRFADADEELGPALDKLEIARQLVSDETLQASYFAAERKCYELAVELRMRQFEHDPAEGADALALEMGERSRARGLLDALSERATSGARESGEVEARLMQAKMAVDRAYDGRLKLFLENGAKLDLEASSTELTQALGDLERADDDAHAAAIHAPKPALTMTTADIEQASLGAGATFFEYSLGQERSYLWVVGGGKLKSYVLPPRKQLEEMVKQWRALAAGQERADADASAKLKRLSAQLSCALFADAIQPGMTRLVIVPDGELAMLPFAALPANGCSGAPRDPLVADHEIVLAPSLSVFLSSKPEEDHTFQGEVAIVADPVFDAADPRAAAAKGGASKHDSHPAQLQEVTAALPRLFNAGYEARAIQDAVHKAPGNKRVFLAQGFDANVGTILSPAMQDYRIWHLATHGIYDETMPEFSGLVFSLVARDGSSRFGFLKAHDIARMNVRAELVVLSACDSAAGENVNGEGVMGLSYAFLHAGAKQVISTLWSVDDEKSRDLMIAFYKELMQNGGNAAAALRQSQLTLMRQHQSSSPYYWAGFELTSVGQ